VPQLQTVRILWFAIMASTAMFLGVLVKIKPVPLEPPGPQLLAVLAFAALATAVMSRVVPSIAARNMARQLSVPSKTETIADPSRPVSEILPAGAAPTQTRLVPVDPALARQRAFMAFMTPFILSLALSEAVALFGFVVGFLGFGLALALPFFVLSWILIGLRFPTLERVIAPFERAKGLHIPRA
jgi:F0F1-type ATP synthase membrane subunit c/vacuolar-type H+-ATPase subunit K